MVDHLLETSVDMEAIDIQCDSCNARSRYRVIFIDGEQADKDLLFCGHHMHKHYEAIANRNVWILDDMELPPF